MYNILIHLYKLYSNYLNRQSLFFQHIANVSYQYTSASTKELFSLGERIFLSLLAKVELRFIETNPRNIVYILQQHTKEMMALIFRHVAFSFTFPTMANMLLASRIITTTINITIIPPAECGY